MPEPIALCIEYLDAREREDRYMRCVALPGYDVALGLDERGETVWRDPDRIACELWVSADDQLIIVRREGGPETVVYRAGRSLSLPADKPVVLIDCDRVDVGARRLRVHVHGVAGAVHEPAPLEERTTRPLAAIAAAVAISASAVGCKPSSGVHETPSAEPVPVAPPSSGPAEASSAATPVDGGADAVVEEPSENAEADGGDVSVPAASVPPIPTKPPIRVRDRPPKPVPPRDGGF